MTSYIVKTLRLVTVVATIWAGVVTVMIVLSSASAPTNSDPTVQNTTVPKPAPDPPTRAIPLETLSVTYDTEAPTRCVVPEKSNTCWVNVMANQYVALTKLNSQTVTLSNNQGQNVTITSSVQPTAVWLSSAPPMLPLVWYEVLHNTAWQQTLRTPDCQATCQELSCLVCGLYQLKYDPQKQLASLSTINDQVMRRQFKLEPGASVQVTTDSLDPLWTSRFITLQACADVYQCLL